MSKIMEERCKEAVLLVKIQMVMNLLSLGTVSKTDISKASGFTLEEIDEIEQDMAKANT